MELVGVIFWLFWFPWFAFLVCLALVDAAWPRGSREVSFGKLKNGPGGYPGLKIDSAILKSNYESNGFRQPKISSIF
jgi:hypothetical protein